MIKLFRVSVFTIVMFFFFPHNANARMIPPSPFNHFNYIQCVECGNREKVGLLLAYRIVKNCYGNQEYSVSPSVYFGINTALETIRKIIGVAIIGSESLYDFFFADDKSSLNEEQRGIILSLLNEHYKCIVCGAGSWRYIFFDEIGWYIDKHIVR